MKHLPENIWQSPVIRKRLEAEAAFECAHGSPQKPQYWICVPDATNISSRHNAVLKNYNAGVLDIDPHEMQQSFVQELRYRLQKEVGHDGVWIAGFTHPPATFEAIKVDGDNCWNRLVMIWLDGDCDPQFTVEFDRPFVELIQEGGHYLL